VIGIFNQIFRVEPSTPLGRWMASEYRVFIGESGPGEGRRDSLYRYPSRLPAL
jgi:hypothetical protein